MRVRQDIWFFVSISACVLVLISIPYLIAVQNAGSDVIFAGFLINPLDGNSYLAKIYQGWEGSWLFHLPYTPEEGIGAYLNLFYLALGHLARLLSLTPVLAFHLARLVCAALLLWALWRFFGACHLSSFARRLAFVLAILGSGLGWIAGLFGLLTSDLWVAEAFPFLAVYTNPHFPLGLALLLLILTPQSEQSIMPDFTHQFLWAVLSALMTIVMPFGLVVASAVFFCLATWELIESQRLARMSNGVGHPGWIFAVLHSNSWQKFGWVAVGGVPILFYDLWVTYNDPLLSGWNAQNLTPSPAWWDLLISFGVLIILGIPGALSLLKRYCRSARILLVWIGVSLVLIFLPIGLQRRFMIGMLIPLAGLAALGIENLVDEVKRRKVVLTGLVLILLLPTNLIVLMSGLYGVYTHDPLLYLSKDEVKVMAWLEENTSEDALVLASPSMGLFIPAHTGRRVIYGHPFETVSASDRRSQVERLLSGTEKFVDLTTCKAIDYVFWGPREQAYTQRQPVFADSIAFESGEVILYQADPSSCER